MIFLIFLSNLVSLFTFRGKQILSCYCDIFDESKKSNTKGYNESNDPSGRVINVEIFKVETQT